MLVIFTTRSCLEDGADFIVADDEFIADVLGIGTDTAPLLEWW